MRIAKKLLLYSFTENWTSDPSRKNRPKGVMNPFPPQESRTLGHAWFIHYVIGYKSDMSKVYRL